MDNDEKRKKKLEASKRYNAKNREAVLARKRAFYEANKERLRAENLANYHKNREYYLVKMRKYKEDNIEKLKIANAKYRCQNKEGVNRKTKEWRLSNPEYAKQWQKENADKSNAATAKRRSKRLQATPSWLTEKDFNTIEMFYEAAADQKQYGLKCHVDHIVPLQGENASGLHVPWNLRVIPAAENISKNNKLPEHAECLARTT